MQCMELQITVATWRIKTNKDSAFYQITLLLVTFSIIRPITENMLTQNIKISQMSCMG